MPCTCAICGYSRKITEAFKKWSMVVGSTVDIYPVTKNGDPDRELQGFICARCLNNANSMRIHIKSLLSGIQVTKHAIERFINRFPGQKMNEDSAKNAIIKIFNHSRPIRFKNGFMIERIINNQFKAVNYFYHDGFIFVVTQEKPPTILTVEDRKGKKLEIDFWYTDE